MDVDPILQETADPEVNTHVRDYSRFVQLLKWGAILSLVIAFIVLLLISN